MRAENTYVNGYMTTYPSDELRGQFTDGAIRLVIAIYIKITVGKHW